MTEHDPLRMQAQLAGRVAVVTGATRRAGLGAAVALELAEAGAAVCITHFREYDRRQAWGVAPDEPESILEALGTHGAGIELDLSSPSAAVDLFNHVESRFGPVDILINNAAHWEPGGIRHISAEQLDRHYAVNTRAAVLLCAEFVRRPRPHAGGRIINVTSGQGQTPMPGELAYAVTKAGLEALTLSLAADLQASGVTVNAVDPGPIDTGWMTADLRRSLAATSAAGRLARPEDLAGVVRLLCGDDAAGITGRIIHIQAQGVVESLKRELAPSLSPLARDVLTQLRAWVATLPADTVVIREEVNPNYGGFLFTVTPTRPGAVSFTVGLGVGDDVDFFWGDGYRWEGWDATPAEVLEECESIRQGDICEETWTIGRYVLERRAYVQPHGRRSGDGSYPMPQWLKRWATCSIRTFPRW